MKTDFCRKYGEDECGISFEIHEHIGVLKAREICETGTWRKEVNLVSWNGGEKKVDIRGWNDDHDRMTRGLALFEDEAKELVKSLVAFYI